MVQSCCEVGSERSGLVARCGESEMSRRFFWYEGEEDSPVYPPLINLYPQTALTIGHKNWQWPRPSEGEFQNPSHITPQPPTWTMRVLSSPLCFVLPHNRDDQPLGCTARRSAGQHYEDTRRAFINTINETAGGITVVCLPSAAHAVQLNPTFQRISSPKIIVEYILDSCYGSFVSSVVQSEYNFLYRGLSPEQSEAVSVRCNKPAGIIVRDELYDLLDPQTYQSNEAAFYFQKLEKVMSAKGLGLKPSNSHIGTTCPKEAARWGKAASIWPIGEDGVEFAWLEEGGLFWPPPDVSIEREVTSGAGKGEQGLATALQGDAWEIMFRADNGFLAVPSELDDELRVCLRELN